MIRGLCMDKTTIWIISLECHVIYGNFLWTYIVKYNCVAIQMIQLLKYIRSCFTIARVRRKSRIKGFWCTGLKPKNCWCLRFQESCLCKSWSVPSGKSSPGCETKITKPMGLNKTVRGATRDTQKASKLLRQEGRDEELITYKEKN